MSGAGPRSVVSTDDEITRRALDAKGGDRAAEAFVAATRHQLGRFVLHLVGPADADDLVQEVYLRAMRALPAFTARSSARTWLLAIARRACADHIRTATRRPRIAALRLWQAAADAKQLRDRADAGFESGVALADLIRGLSADRRDAFVATQVAGGGHVGSDRRRSTPAAHQLRRAGCRTSLRGPGARIRRPCSRPFRGSSPRMPMNHPARTGRLAAAFAAGAALVASVAVAAAVLLPAAPAWAHNELVASVPAGGAELAEAPREVVLTFAERLDPRFTQIVVTDAAKATVPTGAPAVSGATGTLQLPRPLADGGYTVAYRVVSVDGHPVQGSFRFSVGAPLAGSPSAAAPAAAVRRDGWPASAWGAAGAVAVTALAGGILLWRRRAGRR